MKLKSKGVVDVWIIVGVLAVLAVGAFVFWRVNRSDDTIPISTQDAEELIGNVQSEASDVERRTDLTALQSQLEVFREEKGYYPTTANIEDSLEGGWVDQNLGGLDIEALVNPPAIAINQTGGYQYIASPSDCDNVSVMCSGYTLSVDLGSDGLGDQDTDGNLVDYAKDSLN